MFGKPITPQQIEQATLRISCGEESGSGFFVSDTLILTARHVVIDAIEEQEHIYVARTTNGTSKDPILCTLLGDGGEELDIALLQLSSGNSDIALPLSNSQVRYNARWETFGFPYAHQISGNRYLGSVRKTNNDKPYDLELINDSIDNTVDYRGLSGSALVIENAVAGVVTFNITDGFGAISTSKIADFLNHHGVVFRTKKEPDDLPDPLKEDLENIVDNGTTLALLDEKLTKGGKYYVLHGSPGSGKTLLSAVYNFKDSEKIVAGRYFVRLPNEQRPTSYRVSRETFLEWMEDLISQKVYGSIYPKQSVTLNERIKAFHQLLNALNDYYLQRNEIGFIIIDGLDDIRDSTPNGLVDFFGLLPETLPSNLSFLLAIIRKDSLPPNIQALVDSTQDIKVTPLEIDKCIYYLRKSLNKEMPELNFSILQQIAEKSEGHPLYLRYLIEQLNIERPTDLSSWVDYLPTIDGDIAKYYERIWLTDFQRDQDKFWIALIVSQLRQPISTVDLQQMLPSSVQLAFTTQFPSIRHLFKVNGTTGIYHSSFALFIEKKSGESVPVAHDHIVSFCHTLSTHSYSITNIIHHILRSSKPESAINHCDQQWADACARISVEPELVLSDMSRVELFFLEHGNFIGFVRVKLLMQRIRFRYDNVLAVNASAIARVLLATGKPADALKYIVRFSMLIISDEEALWFLRMFHEIGAKDEFDLLLRAIRTRYQDLFEQEKNEGSTSFRVIRLMSKSKTLSLAGHRLESIKEITKTLKWLKAFAESNQNSGENAHHIYSLCEELGSYHSGFVAYDTKQYSKCADQLKLGRPEVPETEWASTIARTSLAFDSFFEKDKTIEEGQVYNNMMEDIEYAIDNFGYLQTDAPFIYAALLEDSKRPELVKALISETYPSAPILAIRKSNGVDADFAQINRIINYHEGQGYLDETDYYPLGNVSFSPTSWEEALVDHIKLIGFCFGKAWRLKAEDNLSRIDSVIFQLSSIVLEFNFTLKERIKWDNSYALPEHIFPYLYYKFTKFYREFAPSKLDGFVRSVFASDNQLGLYTEGYRNLLSQVISVVCRSRSTGPLTVFLLKKLEQHVLVATQNRWERVPILLEIAEHYANIGNNDKAEIIYQEMLNTSMGPTWYKEDQFTLINTALSLPNVTRNNPFFQDFAKQLEFASGELTFQRYVRVAQQTFINNMTSQDNIASAIDYYQYQTVPSPRQIIANAERSTIDAISPGDGYVLGARSIIEASGIYNLLANTEADPLLIWAFTEIFYINDDTYRYIGQYAGLQAECLERLSTLPSSPELSFLRGRLRTCVENPDLDRNRHHYLKELLDVLPSKEYNTLVDSLGHTGIKFPKPKQVAKERSLEEDEKMDAFNFPGVGKQSNFRKIPEILSRARSQAEMDNRSASTNILAEGLLLLHEGKSDIWMGSNLGDEVKSLWDELSIHGTIPEILSLLREPIANRNTQDWRVVDKLLRVVESQLKADQVNEILKIIKDHVHFMIRDPETIQEFNWQFSTEEKLRSDDEELISLLIWLLDHPYVSTKRKTIQALLMLCEFRPNVILALLAHSLSEDQSIAKEICSYLIYRLSIEQADLVLKVLGEYAGLTEKILEEKHFMTRYYLLKTAENLRSKDEKVELLYQSIHTSFPQSIKPGADVEFDEPYLFLINPILDQLKNLDLLNGVFCRDFLEVVTQLSKPLTISEQFRAGYYLERSYYDDETHYRRGVHILRQAINLSITPRVSKDNIEHIADILKNNIIDGN